MPKINPDHQAIIDSFLARRRALHGALTMNSPTPPAPTPPPAPQPPAPPAPPATPPGEPQDRTFSQDQLNGIVGREVAQAREAASRQLLQELGVDNLDAAKAALQAAETARQAQLSEAQRAQEAAQAAQVKAQQDAQQAQLLGHQYLVDLALMRAGIVADGTEQGDARVAGIRRLVDVAPGADQAAVAAAVDKTKELYPALFGPQQTGPTPPTPPRPPAPPSDPAGRPPAPVIGDSAYERGLARAKAKGGAGPDGPVIKPAGL